MKKALNQGILAVVLFLALAESDTLRKYRV